MLVNKSHIEFHRLDLDQGWVTSEGYASGIQQKSLAGDLDEKRKMGSHSRLLRFAPGAYMTTPRVQSKGGCMLFEIHYDDASAQL